MKQTNGNKLTKKVVTVGIAVLLVAVLGMVTFADTVANTASSALGQMRAYAGQLSDQHPVALLAKLLGITEDALLEQHKTLSLGQIAENNNKLDAYKTALTDAKKVQYDALVKAGRLTQAQADAGLAAYKTTIQAAKAADLNVMGQGRGQGMGMGQGRGQGMGQGKGMGEKAGRGQGQGNRGMQNSANCPLVAPANGN